jgi:outer membrane protein assembly factor BamE (lipoprotein component of BamABCDE complex)
MNPNYKAMKKHFHFITIFMLLFLFIGCLYVPPVGRQIGNEELKTIEIGSTTKAEVTNLLGKPDLLENERFYGFLAELLGLF